MTSEVLVVPTSAIPDYVERVTLDDVSYVLRFRWNTRGEMWFLDIFDADNNPLVYGRPCLVGNDLIAHLHHVEGMPPGELVPFDTTDRQVDPGLLDFGRRVLLLYETTGGTE